jgi:hypothetical protein
MGYITWSAAAALLVSGLSVKAQEVPVTNAEYRDPVVAGLLSGAIPGAGQVYNHQFLKGARFFVVGAGTLFFALEQVCQTDIAGSEVCERGDWAPMWAVMFATTSAMSVFDAVRTSKRLNAEARARIQPTVSANGRVGVKVELLHR